MNLKTLRTATMIAAITGVAGCAVLPKRDRWVSVKPVQSTAQQESGVDGDYAAAVSAISRRDYAQALDMLQAANARKIDDVRVLNAFGVVYDKLGRFDLSARYYARARAADANSTIVASNVAYSAALQQQYAVAPTRELVEAPSPLMLAAAPPRAIRLAATATPVMLPLIPAARRRGLEIADASGRPGAAGAISLELARLGWSTPKTAISQAPKAARTTITYAAYRAPVARSLARTLPPGVRLVDCEDACGGVRLTLGADSLAWPLRARAAVKRLG
jgi:tetratricopeptide (TPR) repeat protein